MKFRWWPHTLSTSVASHRLRCLQIVDALRAQGVDAGLYDPDSGEVPDVLVLARRYDPETLAAAEALRARSGTRLVLDLCDNHFYLETPDARLVERAGNLRLAVSRADAVIASTATLANVIASECSGYNRIHVIGDAVEPPFTPSAWHRLQRLKPERELWVYRRQLAAAGAAPGGRVVWFGSHGSPGVSGGMDDIGRIRDALHEAHARRPLVFTVISNSLPRFRALTSGWSVPVLYLPWRLETFSRALAMQDVAAIPVGVNPFTICKTNNRVLTSIAHGLAVIADTIPAYRDFADAAVLDDWSALDRLCGDPAWRARLVDTGRDLQARHWTLDEISRRWLETLRAIHERENLRGHTEERSEFH